MIELRNISKNYAVGESTVAALRNLSLQINAGEFVALTGHSGSGKSTLMAIIGCLESPSGGSYCLDGIDVSAMNEDDLAHARNRHIGFVFQSFNLNAQLNSWENVAQPLVFRGVRPAARREAAIAALRLVGLEHRLTHRPVQLSGGERQRVAIARAIVGQPKCILADEPTGNLDSDNAANILELLGQFHKRGMTIVLVTHNPEVATRAARTVVLRDGALVQDQISSQHAI